MKKVGKTTRPFRYQNQILNDYSGSEKYTREAKGKGEKERYNHLNAEFQRIARRDKKDFSDQYKEMEENNRMGKPREFQYFGHLMRRVDSLEKTLMLGGIGGRRRRG